MIKEKFPFIEEVKPEKGEGWFIIPSDKLSGVCLAARDEFKFNCLSSLTGTDKGDYVEVVYHLYSYETKESIVLKVKTNPPNPPLEGGFEVPSVSKIWSSAEWMEREVYDLLGVKFSSHPDLRRIMMPEDWEGHPLKKDYKEPQEYRGMTTVRNSPPMSRRR
jgi:NADH-quinone oxidoreductase subunit C